MGASKTQILVVSEAQGRNIRYALATFGLEPTLVPNAELALSLLKTVTPDLLVIDAHLKDMRGTVLCDRVKRVKRLSEVPTILFVNEADDHMLADARMSRADDVLMLPFSARDLRSSVKHFLGQSLPASAAHESEQPSDLN